MQELFQTFIFKTKDEKSKTLSSKRKIMQLVSVLRLVFVQSKLNVPNHLIFFYRSYFWWPRAWRHVWPLPSGPRPRPKSLPKTATSTRTALISTGMLLGGEVVVGDCTFHSTEWWIAGSLGRPGQLSCKLGTNIIIYGFYAAVAAFFLGCYRGPPAADDRTSSLWGSQTIRL